MRESDHHELVVSQRGRISVFDEVLEMNGPRAIRPKAVNRSVERDQGIRPVAARIGFGERKPEKADPARIPILQAICAQTWCRHADLTGRSLTSGHDVQDLTSKEVDILQWIKHGKSNAEIAEILPLSVKTIEYHVGNVLKKLGAANRTTAVVIAIKHRLLAL